MTRKEHKRRQGALRKLLRNLTVPEEGQPDFSVEYRFGALYHRQSGIWHIYNSSSDNCIATVNLVSEPSVIGYREVSHWAYVLKNFRYSDDTIVYPSQNLARRSRWVRENMLRRLNRPSRRAAREDSPSSGGSVVLQPDGRLRDERGRWISAGRMNDNQRRAYEQLYRNLLHEQLYRNLSQHGFRYATYYVISPNGDVEGINRPDGFTPYGVIDPRDAYRELATTDSTNTIQRRNLSVLTEMYDLTSTISSHTVDTVTAESFIPELDDTDV